MSETPHERARRFFDSVPEPEGSLEDVMEQAAAELRDRITAAWRGGEQ